VPALRVSGTGFIFVGKKTEILEEIQEEQDISERKGGQQFTDSSQWLITKGRTGEELKVIKISSL
jgi:hypothetical protein